MLSSRPGWCMDPCMGGGAVCCSCNTHLAGVQNVGPAHFSTSVQVAGQCGRSICEWLPRPHAGCGHMACRPAWCACSAKSGVLLRRPTTHSQRNTYLRQAQSESTSWGHPRTKVHCLLSCWLLPCMWWKAPCISSCPQAWYSRRRADELHGTDGHRSAGQHLTDAAYHSSPGMHPAWRGSLLQVFPKEPAAHLLVDA